ncbi:hypothetical protein J8281_14255 [Aquimarina sp. U1-2]|nr:hypothetical protein [Aquimarina sp. U1-2]
MSCNENKKENKNSEKQQTETKHTEIEQKTNNFDWLVGKWKRLDEEEGKETFENWAKNSETEYSGIGFTMQNNDTIKQERMILQKNNGKWELNVKVPDEPESVTFRMTEHNEKEFVCVNNEIDFPNKIHYWKTGDRINATVSNSEMEIPFEFERLSE